MIVWITGLPCSGKTTLARALFQRITLGRAVVLDSEDWRSNCWPELGYTDDDRCYNVARLGYVARQFSQLGLVAIVAAVSPFRKSRDLVRAANPGFFEVYLECPDDVRVSRDKRGVMAMGHPLNTFHQAPESPEVRSRTDMEHPEDLADRVIYCMTEKGLLHGH